MKLGEIKLEALKIMNEAGYKNLSIQRYDYYLTEPRFQKFLFNMQGSINRAIDYINFAEILSPKSITLFSIESVNGLYIYDTHSITDIYEPLYIYCVTDEGILYPEFDIFGAKLYVKNFAECTLVYRPKLNHITDESYDDEVNIPNEIALIIPYYIKYDLYQEEEPNLAIEAKKTFEELVTNMKKSVSTNNDYIKAVYSQL